MEAVQDALELAAEGRHELASDSDVPDIDLGPQGGYEGQSCIDRACSFVN